MKLHVFAIAAAALMASAPAMAWSSKTTSTQGHVMQKSGSPAYASSDKTKKHVVRKHQRSTVGMKSKMDRDNTSVPGQGVEKDDTTPRMR